MNKFLRVVPLAAFALAAACSDHPLEPSAFPSTLPGNTPSRHLDDGTNPNNQHDDLTPALSAATLALGGSTVEPGTPVTIAWTAAAGSPTTVTQRTRYRYALECTGAGCVSIAETDVALSVLSFATPNLTAGTYVAKVRGLGGPNSNSVNHGSVWVTVSFSVGSSAPVPVNQTVTFDASEDPTGVTYGDDPHIDISNWASASSPITYSSETPSVCTVAGVEVAIVAAGSCTVKASAEANAFYNAASGTRSFAIGQAPLTVTADNQSKTYDGDVFSGFTASYSGLVYAQNSSVLGGTLSFGGSAVTATGAGSYTITPSGLTSSNYDISFVNGTLTIDKADADIVVDGFSGLYDGTAKGASGSATGAAGEALSALLDVGDSFTNVPGGTANWSFAGDDNHNPDAGSVSILIDPRPVTITPDGNQGKIFGEADPSLLTYTASEALIAGNAFSGNLSRVAGEAVGSYDITLGTLSAGDNYQLSLASPAVQFTIGAWNAQGHGFYQPVGVGNSVFVASGGPLPTPGTSTVWNVVKGGSTVPLKFNVFAGDVAKTSTSDISGFAQHKLNTCNGGAGTDDVEFVTSGNTSLRYDATDGQFIQNWKTPTASGETCYRATVTFKDGSTLSAFFRLRK